MGQKYQPSSSADMWRLKREPRGPPAYQIPLPLTLFHDLLLRSYLYHCVWSVITAHNLTPEKRDNN